jgi:hypothetical protein
MSRSATLSPTPHALGATAVKTTAALLAALLLSGSAVGLVGAKQAASGFQTKIKPMLDAAAPDVSAKALLSVGDTLDNGYAFQSIPDGIAIDTRGSGVFDVYVNHETSKVAFTGQADYDNSMLSKLSLKLDTARVLDGSIVIPSSANFVRFCSNFMAGPAQGFDDWIVFTNEETNDVVNRTGTSWPLSEGSNPEQAGVTVAYDVDASTRTKLYGLGRMNHENAVAIPGYADVVLITADDTFTSNPPSSQLYMYIAADSDGVLADTGALYAFKADPSVDDTAPTGDDYYDVAQGDTVTGDFIAVDSTAAHGDQNALEAWSDSNGIFQFVRLEDVAYDRTDPNVIYLADTGRGSASAPTAAPNGRIWRMELDPTDPTVVDSLTILEDGDAAGFKAPGVIHQPDNLETTANALYVTEDPAVPNQFILPTSDVRATTARVWRYDFATETWSVIARVDQSLDPAAALGSWEATGIVDASAISGPGTFLVNIQAHTLFLRSGAHPTVPGVLEKEEGGQLLLLRVLGG